MHLGETVNTNSTPKRISPASEITTGNARNRAAEIESFCGAECIARKPETDRPGIFGSVAESAHSEMSTWGDAIPTARSLLRSIKDAEFKGIEVAGIQHKYDRNGQP